MSVFAVRLPQTDTYRNRSFLWYYRNRTAPKKMRYLRGASDTFDQVPDSGPGHNGLWGPGEVAPDKGDPDLRSYCGQQLQKCLRWPEHQVDDEVPEVLFGHNNWRRRCPSPHEGHWGELSRGKLGHLARGQKRDKCNPADSRYFSWTCIVSLYFNNVFLTDLKVRKEATEFREMADVAMRIGTGIASQPWFIRRLVVLQKE